MTEMDRTIQASLDAAIDLRTAATDDMTVAAQLVSVAQTIKGIHRDLDALQAEFGKQLDAIRKRLGGRG